MRVTLFYNVIGRIARLEFPDPKPRGGVGHESCAGGGAAGPFRGDGGLRREMDLGKECAAL